MHLWVAHLLLYRTFLAPSSRSHPKISTFPAVRIPKTNKLARTFQACSRLLVSGEERKIAGKPFHRRPKPFACYFTKVVATSTPAFSLFSRRGGERDRRRENKRMKREEKKMQFLKIIVFTKKFRINISLWAIAHLPLP